MKRIAIALGLLSLSLSANAQTTYPVTLSWTPPTMNTDGTELTDLAGYVIYWGTAQGEYPNSVSLTDPSLVKYVLDLPQGGWYFVMTAVNSLNRASDYSAMAFGTSGPNPEAPVLRWEDRVLRTVDTIVYSDQKQNNRKEMRPVGDVFLDVPCIASEAIMADGEVYYGVPREEVAFVGLVRPDIVYARCE